MCRGPLKFILAFFLSGGLLPWNIAAAAVDVSSHHDSEVLSRAASREIGYSDQYFQTATRSLQKINRVTENVEVITREELDRWPVQDLDEALGMINGIVVQDVGNIGQTATGQIYGSKPREVRVMVDGITFNATTTGGIADLSQIPLDMVEKIEIIKGASSSVWGSAMGGVVNIVTRPPGKKLVPQGSAAASFGDYGTQRQRGELSGAAGPLRYYGFGSHVRSGGFRPDSDESERRSFLKTEVPLYDELIFAGTFGYSESKISEFDLPDVSQTAKRKVLSRYGSAGFIYSPAENFQTDIFYKLSNRRFRRGTRTFPARNFIQMAKAESIIHELSVNSVWNMTEHQTLVFGSDVGVEAYHDAVFRATTTPSDINKESTQHAYYANYQLSWWWLDTTIGSRLDATNSYGVYFDPSAGTVLHLPFWNSQLRANVSRAFNAPSFVDRYLSSGTSLVANPDLEAEKAIAYNTGFETSPYSWIHGKAIFFQTFITDSILTITRSDGLRQPVNIDRERRTGFETELKLGPWMGFSPSYGTAYVMAVDPATGVLQSRPRLTQDIKLNYHVVVKDFDFNAHLEGRYMDLVQYSGFTPPIDRAFIFNSKIILGFPKVLYGRVSVFLECDNLFNGDFSFDGGRDPNPKRNLEGGVQFKF